MKLQIAPNRQPQFLTAIAEGRRELAATGLEIPAVSSTGGRSIGVLTFVAFGVCRGRRAITRDITADRGPEDEAGLGGEFELRVTTDRT
jgi:hypothetical protein